MFFPVSSPSSSPIKKSKYNCGDESESLSYTTPTPNDYYYSSSPKESNNNNNNVLKSDDNGPSSSSSSVEEKGEGFSISTFQPVTTDTARTTILTAATHNMRLAKRKSSSSVVFVVSVSVSRPVSSPYSLPPSSHSPCVAYSPSSPSKPVDRNTNERGQKGQTIVARGPDGLGRKTMLFNNNNNPNSNKDQNLQQNHHHHHHHQCYDEQQQPQQQPQPASSKTAIFAILWLLCLLCSGPNCVQGLGEITWAVNCGGGSHTDIQGIRYQADYLKTGIASDYGKNLMIQRIVPQDQILYQTERYHTSTFGYEIPIKEDGDYVVVLKFCEVWFTSANQKIFDIVLNGEHTVVDELDIFAKVGRGVAHDEMLPFSIKNGKLKVNGETSQINGKVTVEFIKGDADNPKINAIYMMKGTLDDVPKLPSLPGAEPPQLEEEEEEEEEESPEAKSPSKSRRPSGPKAQDPYAADDTSTMLLPVFVAIGAFIPLLFCLCRL